MLSRGIGSRCSQQIEKLRMVWFAANHSPYDPLVSRRNVLEPFWSRLHSAAVQPLYSGMRRTPSPKCALGRASHE